MTPITPRWSGLPILLSVGSLPGPPDTIAAGMAMEAALHEIGIHLEPKYRASTLSALRGDCGDGSRTQGQDTVNRHIACFIEVIARTPEWRDRYQRFFLAQHHWATEMRRARSIAEARGRLGGWRVTVTLVQPPCGTMAAVWRRQYTHVVVLGPDATAETLDAALWAFERSVAAYGDNWSEDLLIGVRPTDVRRVTGANRRAGLVQWLDSLQRAPTRLIEGVGTARWIDITPQLNPVHSTYFGSAAESPDAKYPAWKTDCSRG